MANVVTITLRAKNQAMGAFNDLDRAMRNSTMSGNLMAQGIGAAFGVVAGGIAAATNAIKEASDIQASSLTTAGDFMKMTGKSFDEATTFVDNFSVAMAKQAADLPGVTKEYVSLGKSLMDNLLPAFQGLDGSLDDKAYKENLEAITTMGALRVANTQATTAQAANALGKAIGGSASIKALQRMKFFTENPAVLSVIEKEADRLGTKLEDMTDRQRADVIRKALAVPDEIIKASRESVAGMIEGLRSTLFDPQFGAFGLLRDTSAMAGDQSAFAAIGEVVRTLLGPDGLFETVAETMASIGFNPDVMASLYGGLMSFNQWLESVNQWLGGLVLTDGFAVDIASDFGRFVGRFWTDAIGQLAGADWSAFSHGLGTMIAAMASYMGGAAMTFPVSEVVALAFVVAAALGDALSIAIMQADWPTIIMGGLKVLAVTLVAMTIFSFVAGFGALVLAVGGAIAYLVYRIVSDWAVISEFWGAQFKRAFDAVFGFIEGILTGMAQLSLGMLTGMAQATQAVIEFIANGIEAVGGAVTGLFSRIASAISSLNPMNAGAGRRKGSKAVPNAAGGQNVGSFFAAIAREQLASRAPITIANASETILNSAQAAAAARAAGQGGGSSASLSVGNITINAGAANDPKALAQMVIAEIDRQWSTYSQQKLAIG